MLSDRINKWYASSRHKLFKYKDGFFELPYLANTPKTVIESIDKMPFIIHDKKAHSLRSRTPLASGTVFYEELEQGFWVIVGDFKYHANIIFKKAIDSEIPSDYYFLCLTVSGMKQKSSLINGIAYTKCSWLLFKPNIWVDSCQFRGGKELTFTLMFDERWIKNLIRKKKKSLPPSFVEFFHSESKYLIQEDNPKRVEKAYEKIYKNFTTTKLRTAESKEGLLVHIQELFDLFYEKFETRDLISNIHNIPYQDKVLMFKAEKFLLKNLSTKFPGILKISKELGVSPTKLKTSFKLIFAKGLFQYFQEKQMRFAYEIISQSNGKVKIGELANSLGYENASKFSAAFKKNIGIPPSEIK